MKNWEKALYEWAKRKADECAAIRKRQGTSQLDYEYWRGKEIAYANVMTWAADPESRNR